MAQQRPDYSFDPNELDQEAMLKELGVKAPAENRDAGGAPVSTTMPVTTPTVTPPVTPSVTTATTQTGGATTPATFTRENRDALKYGTVGRTEGFNTSDYGGDVKARNSVKNTFGRIASRYANAPNSIDAMMADPDFRAAFPNAKRVPGGAGDKIDFGGVLSDFESGVPVGVVDVLTMSDPGNNTANGWAWMPDGEGGTTAAPATPTSQGVTGQRIDTVSPARPAVSVADVVQPTDDPMEKILAEIEALQNGGASPMDQQALMQLLGI